MVLIILIIFFHGYAFYYLFYFIFSGAEFWKTIKPDIIRVILIVSFFVFMFSYSPPLTSLGKIGLKT